MVLLLDTDSTLDVLYPLVALYALTVATKSVSVIDCGTETSPVSQQMDDRNTASGGLVRRGGLPEFQRSWTIRCDHCYVLTRTLRFPSSVFRYVVLFGSHDYSR